MKIITKGDRPRIYTVKSNGSKFPTLRVNLPAELGLSADDKIMFIINERGNPEIIELPWMPAISLEEAKKILTDLKM